MLELKLPQLPDRIQNIDSPPAQLYYEGADLLKLLEMPCVTIVGTRKISPYGRMVTEEIADNLARQGVVIISGLAYGVDATAHQAVVDAGGRAIAVLPSPVDYIVPVANRRLADEILDQGGCIVSEYPSGSLTQKQFFIARNRLMSALAKVVVVTEAGPKSGAKHTATFAINQGRTVMAVPGNIYSIGSQGINELLTSGEASVVTSYTDILSELGLSSHETHVKQVKGNNKNEQMLLELMLQGVREGHILLEKSHLEVSTFNQSLTMLEISGKIRPLGANNWAIK
jgi:DNA processing protein